MPKMLDRFVTVRNRDGNDIIRQFSVPQFRSIAEAVEYLGELAVLSIVQKHCEQREREMAKFALRVDLQPALGIDPRD